MVISAQTLLFLLLPVAAASGWIVARYKIRASKSRVTSIHPDYLKGMNYLISERPDKAIEVFLRLSEVDEQTAETHFALAGLYRRRGEVDRAIHIHQDLVVHHNLDDSYRDQALYELAQDYFAAGLLDRAEDLLIGLLKNGTLRGDALRALLKIYEQEKDWPGAVSMAQQLEALDGVPRAKIIAHYYCEMAELAESEGKIDLAMEYLEQALVIDPGSVRCSIIEGRMAWGRDDCLAALMAYRRVIDQDIYFASEVLDEVCRCFQAIGDSVGERAFLTALAEQSCFPGLRGKPLLPLLTLAKNHDELMREFEDYASESPNLAGICSYLTAISKVGSAGSLAQVDGMLPTVRQALNTILARENRYRCGNCGFSANTLYWQCPGCRFWGRVIPQS